jgi:sarcosine oxidase subunit beta
MHIKIILAAGYMDAVKSGTSSGVTVAANIQQMPNGNLLLGSSWQFVEFDPSVDPNVIANMIQRNLRFFPALRNITAIRTWSGFRPYTPDLLPIISACDEVQGLYFACGHDGIGITEGPATGKLISQLISGQTTDISLERFSFARFQKHTTQMHE